MVAGNAERGAVMTRPHRAWHARIWLVLGPLLLIGFLVGLRVRPRPLTMERPAAGIRDSAATDLPRANSVRDRP
jgi:hypothetical protein